MNNSEASTLLLKNATKELRHPMFWEFLSIVASRLYFSPWTSYVYIFTIAMNVIVLGWGLCLKAPTPAFVAVEAFICLLLGVEIFLRFFIQGREYFYHYSNLLDLLIIASCVILLWISLGKTSKASTASNESQVEDALAQSLMIFRVSVQLVRLVAVSVRRSQLPKNDDVVFDSLHSGPNLFEEPLTTVKLVRAYADIV